MRELHGVAFVDDLSSVDLKRYLLLFDKIRTVSFGAGVIREWTDDLRSDLEYLYSQDIVRHGPAFKESDVTFHPWEIPVAPYLRPIVLKDLYVRTAVRKSIDHDCDVVGIYTFPPTDGCGPDADCAKNQFLTTTMSVGLGMLPAPDETCALEDILSFKSEAHDKQWAFRRFLSTLATKRQTEAEIRDDIEWCVNEYSKAMTIHKIKASQSFVDVFIIVPLEIIENLLKFNWSKIAKGALQVAKREVELKDAELKAPGRECAYVFDARKRFV